MNRNIPNQPGARRGRRRILALAALASAGIAAFLGSCNIVGPVALLVAGPEKVSEMYQLDPKRPTVVFIDDGVNRSVMPTRASRRQVGQAADDLLLNTAKFEHVIASQDLLAMVEREKYSKSQSIVELGAGINAEVVIHVAMDSFSIVQSGDDFTPTATARVRVIDVTEKKQVWPEKLDAWYPLTVTAPLHRGALPSGTGERAKVQAELATRVGHSVAFLFIKHELDQTPGTLDH